MAQAGAPPATPATPLPALNPDVVEQNMQNHESRIVPTLQNVVATVNLGAKLDLKQIAMHARNAEYNPKRFAAVIMRIREPKTTALIFASGKMVCTGAKSEEESKQAARRYAKIIQKLGYSVTFTEFKIQNIVGSCGCSFPIRLEGLQAAHSLFVSYEPELFPGLIYRMKYPKIVLLIFVSGKVVLTGAKTRHEIYQAFMNIYPVLCTFRKGQVAPPAPALPRQLPAPGAPPALPAPAAAAAAAMPPPQHIVPGRQQQPQQQQQPPPQAATPTAMLPPQHLPAANMRMAPPTQHQLPPPTPSVHSAPQQHYLPPPTPGLPPPTPAHQPNMPPPSFMGLPPPTPHHGM